MDEQLQNAKSQKEVRTYYFLMYARPSQDTTSDIYLNSLRCHCS